MSPDEPLRPVPATDVTETVNARVQQIIAEAERGALDLRAEVEAEVFQLGREIRGRAEADAKLIVQHAEEQAARLLEAEQRRIEAFAETRIERISAITDDLLTRGEAIAAKVKEADALRAELDELVSGLYAAAQAANAEAGRPPIRLSSTESMTPPPAPRREVRSRVLDDVREARRTLGSAPAEDDAAGSAVRDIASRLPRSPRSHDES